jgi:hypothetical protein
MWGDDGVPDVVGAFEEFGGMAEEAEAPEFDATDQRSRRSAMATVMEDQEAIDDRAAT